jgi:DNA-binding response OmpR family regulator
MKAQRYDLVLMDCEMPILDGFSATQQLRAWEAANQRQRTPVVALTAHILAEHKERARLAGMDGHMAKPVELSQLRELIQYWANRGKPRWTRHIRPDRYPMLAERPRTQGRAGINKEHCSCSMSCSAST